MGVRPRRLGGQGRRARSSRLRCLSGATRASERANQGPKCHLFPEQCSSPDSLMELVVTLIIFKSWINIFFLNSLGKTFEPKVLLVSTVTAELTA